MKPDSFTPRTNCETCPAIFSRKKCLHQNCPSHKAELTAFRRKIDDHVHAMAVQAWHPRTKALVNCSIEGLAHGRYPHRSGGDPGSIPGNSIPAEPHLPGNGAGRNLLFHYHHTPFSCTDYNYFVAQAFSHLLGFPPVLIFGNMFHSHAARAIRRLPECVQFDSCHDGREKSGRLDLNLLCPPAGRIAWREAHGEKPCFIPSLKDE